MRETGVLVVGSINVDLTAFADQLPAPGETVAGTDFTLGLGGKGANQAVAAARFGARTSIVGCVGQDGFADLVTADLREHGVRTDLVRRVPGPTGVAHIRVDAAGQNNIVSTPLSDRTGRAPTSTPPSRRCGGRSASSCCSWRFLPMSPPTRRVRDGRRG